jgi:hypothetical protein
MSEPFIKRTQGDVILAEDWNSIQIQTRDEVTQKIQTHTHTGGANGVLIGGSAIDPASSLTVKNLTVSGTTTLQNNLEVDVPDGAGAWNRFLVRATSYWGDVGSKYVTIGGDASGNGGIMFRNPHVPWLAEETRASIRYGRSDGKPDGAYWDVGSRPGGSFAFCLNAGPAQLTLTSAGTLDLTTARENNGGHPASGTVPFYVTAYNDWNAKGVEFRHANGSQGIGFGFNTIYATGFNADQPLGLQARGKSSVEVFSNLWVHGDGNPDNPRINFNNELGNKLMIYNNGPSDRYGMGLNNSNLSLFVPGGGYFSLRQAGWNGTEVWAINGNGSQRISDGALKDNVVALDRTLDKVMQLRPVSFTWKSDQSDGTGFIAQEVEPIFPELVGRLDGGPEKAEGHKSLRYDGFGVLAIAALQELKKSYDDRIAALEARLNAREGAKPRAKRTRSSGA